MKGLIITNKAYKTVLPLFLSASAPGLITVLSQNVGMKPPYTA